MNYLISLSAAEGEGRGAWSGKEFTTRVIKSRRDKFPRFRRGSSEDLFRRVTRHDNNNNDNSNNNNNDDDDGKRRNWRGRFRCRFAADN